MAGIFQLRRTNPTVDEDDNERLEDLYPFARVIHRSGPGGRKPTRKGKKIISSQQNKKGGPILKVVIFFLLIRSGHPLQLICLFVGS